MSPARILLRCALAGTLVALSCLMCALCAFGAAGDGPAPTNAPSVAIRAIQEPLGEDDASPLIDEVVSTEGIVVARDPIGYVLAETLAGPWRGLYVYDPAHGPWPGDQVRVTGTVTEYYGLTELGQVIAFQVLTQGLSLPEPCLVSTSDLAISRTAEAFESVLVHIGPMTITHDDLGHGEWAAADASGSACVVGTRYDTHYLPRLHEQLAGVTGVVGYAYGHYALHPRDDLDLTLASSHEAFALGGSILTPDVLLSHGYVTVWGTRIVSVGETPGEGLDDAIPCAVIETGALLLPGLINAHDHPSYNLLERIYFGRLFEERYQWYAHPRYWAICERLEVCRDDEQTVNMWKLGELRHLMAGTTTIQGARYSSAWDRYAHPRVLVHNAERLNPRIRNEVKPLDLSEASRARLREGIDAGRYERVVIHLSEGTNEASLDEFATWRDWGLLDESTVIIHGIPLGAQEYAQMAAAGASLVWSPMSNLWLYGETADIPKALRQGVSISLSTDWTLSGSYHLLDELRVAQQVSRERFEDALMPHALVRMVTCEPADQLGLAGRVGRLVPGHLADIAVFRCDAPPESLDAACQAVIDARLEDVLLTLVAGSALYGTPELMGRFPTTGHEEMIGICSQTRVVRATIDAPWIAGAYDTVAEITHGIGSCCPGAMPLNLCAEDRCALPLLLAPLEMPAVPPD